MNLNQCKPGTLVRERYGSATGKIVNVKPSGLVAVFWSGRNIDGTLNGGKGGYDALPSNLEAYTPRKKAGV